MEKEGKGCGRLEGIFPSSKKIYLEPISKITLGLLGGYFEQKFLKISSIKRVLMNKSNF